MSAATGSFLMADVAGREQWRRRVLLWSVALLSVLSISPVVGHHLAARADQALLGGTSMIGALCLVALHLLLAPLHEVFHVALAGGLLYATWDRLRAWVRMRRVLARLEAGRPASDGAVARAASAVGLDPARVRVVPGLPNPAFTVGLLRPAVYVAAELAEWLDDAELRAVLAHEGAHAARRDPLRQSLLRFFACTLFWIPVLRRLVADVADEAEVQADDAAAREYPLALASAILKLAAWRGDGARVPGSTAVGFVCHDILERRVRRLAGEDAGPRTHVTRRSLASATLVLVLGWGSGIVMAHPLPAGAGDGAGAGDVAGAHGGHCADHTGSPLSHLWCGTFAHSTTANCRHGGA